MHDKLSQVVKLYDHLLTQQISQPRWRSSSTVATIPNAPYHQGNPSYNQAYNSANDYQQWTGQAPSSPAASGLDQMQAQPLQMNPGGPAVQEYQSLPGQYPDTRAQTYRAEGPPQQPQPLTEPSQGPRSRQYPTTSQTPGAYNEPQLAMPSQPPQPPEHSQPSQYLPYVAQTPVPLAARYDQNQHLPPNQISGPVYQNPVFTPQSPSRQAQSYAHPPQSPVLSKPHSPSTAPLARHNTLPSLPRTNYPSRHNTVAQPPMHRHQPHQQQPQVHHQSQPQFVASLPQFPVAPTSAPQAFSLHGLSVPSGVPQTEPKEALLIDL
jgi:growth factor-regulated tyrosine kinase substrate